MKTITYKVHNCDVLVKERTVGSYLSNEEMNALAAIGFIRLNYSLDDEHNKLLKELISHQLKINYENTTTNTYKSGKFAGQYLRQPHEQNLGFLKIVSEAYPYVDIVRSLMGPRIAIRSYSVRVTHPLSEDGTAWHSDQRSLVTPRPILFTEPRVLTLGVYLDGATEDNGPLQIRPGSHRWEIQPEGDEMYASFKDEETILFKPGEAVLFDAAIWHRGGKNYSDQQRRMLIIHFAPIFCKTAIYSKTPPCEEFNQYVKKLRSTGNEATLELLGYNGLKDYPGFM